MDIDGVAWLQQGQWIWLLAETVSQKLWLLQVDQWKRGSVESKILTWTAILFKQITKFKDKV